MCPPPPQLQTHTSHGTRSGRCPKCPGLTEQGKATLHHTSFSPAASRDRRREGREASRAGSGSQGSRAGSYGAGRPSSGRTTWLRELVPMAKRMGSVGLLQMLPKSEHTHCVLQATEHDTDEVTKDQKPVSQCLITQPDHEAGRSVKTTYPPRGWPVSAALGGVCVHVYLCTETHTHSHSRSRARDIQTWT